MKEKASLWEILVPRYSNEKVEYSTEYHKKWDKKVRDIAGGITILKTAKGHWINPDGKLFVEEMIPVRIYCTEENIDEILDMTLDHYNQEEVFAYKVSSKIKIKKRQQ